MHLQEGNRHAAAEGPSGRRVQPWEAALGGSGALDRSGEQATKNAEVTPVQGSKRPAPPVLFWLGDLACRQCAMPCGEECMRAASMPSFSPKVKQWSGLAGACGIRHLTLVYASLLNSKLNLAPDSTSFPKRSFAFPLEQLAQQSNLRSSYSL